MTESTPQLTTVRATTVRAPGGPDALVTGTVPIGEPGPGEVAIDVAFAGVNFAEVAQRRGVYPVPAWRFVPGLEASGSVASTGDGVTTVAPGERVVAFCVFGGYAERLVVPAERVFVLPDGLGVREAAASLVTVSSAVAMLEVLAGVSPGSTVAVTAAAGGLGSVAAPVARSLGASHLIGAVGSSSKAEVARGHGYDTVVTYTELAGAVDAATEGRGADVVLDSVGGAVLRAGLDALAPMGRLVKFGAASGEPEGLPAPMELAVANASVMGWSSADLALERPEALRPIAERALALVAAGTVEVPVDEILTLDEAAEAHRRLESRQTTGKLLLDLARP